MGRSVITYENAGNGYAYAEVGERYPGGGRRVYELDETVGAIVRHHSAIDHWRVETLDGNAPMTPTPTVGRPPYRVPLLSEIPEPDPDAPTVVSTFSGAGGSCLGFRYAGYRPLWASEFVPAAAETYRANHPTTPLDERDVRLIQAEEILAELRLEPGDLDVLEGSPPCASFSAAGRRSEHWGKIKRYSDVEQRVDDLFGEYVRLLDGLQPKAFVAENVAGLVRGVAKGYHREILEAMRAAGYRVGARLLDAQWLGVPQRRQRVIYVGVRTDVDAQPAWPDPLPYRYSIRDALPWLDTYGPDRQMPENRTNFAAELPSAAVAADGLGPYARHQVLVEGDGPSLDGYAVGTEYDRLRPGESSDKYLNLIRPDADDPCPTVTQLGGSNPGVASVTHPTERRKFTIAELRRLCGFPDDFVLTGTYPQQWERLGRAVPPPMMRAVAQTIRTEILDPA